MTQASIYWLLNSSTKAKSKDARFISSAVNWIRQNPDNPNTPQLLGTLIKARSEDADVIDININWLRANLEHRQAFWVIQIAISIWFNNKNIIALTKKWIANNPDHANSRNILRIILNKSSYDQELLAFTKDWLSKRLTYSNTSLILGVLLSKYPGDSAVLSLAETFINSCEDADKLSRFARKIQRSLPDNSLVISYFNTWIENNTDIISSSPALLAILTGLFPREKRLHKTIITWLESNYHVVDSYNIICALTNAGYLDNNMKKMTLLWAENIEDPTILIAGLSKIVPYMMNYPDIYERAEATIKRYPHHPDTSLLIAAVISSGKAGLNVFKIVEKWLFDNPDSAINTTLLISMIKAWSSDTLVRDIAISWASDNINHPKVHVVLSSMIKAWPENSSIINICQRWLDVNFYTVYAEQIITPLMKHCKSYCDIYGRAMKWVNNYPTHAKAAYIIAQLIINNPDNQKVYNLANTWITHNFKSPDTRNLLQLILKNKPEEHWIRKACSWQSLYWDKSDHVLLGSMLSATKRGSVLYKQFISRHHLKQRFATLIVLIKAHKAKPYITNLALAVTTNPRVSDENKNEILKQLSRSLVHNLEKAADFINGDWDESKKILVLIAVCHGLHQVPYRISLIKDEFFSKLSCDYQAIFITNIIKRNVKFPETTVIISEWLNNNIRVKGYGAILKNLHLSEEYWNEIENAGIVNPDVIKDYEKFEVINYECHAPQVFISRPSEEDISQDPLSTLEWLEQNSTDEHWASVWQNLWKLPIATNIYSELFRFAWRWLNDGIMSSVNYKFPSTTIISSLQLS